MAGRLIVFEGTDGSGKSTQFRALCDRAAWLREGRIEKTGGPELIETAWGDSAVL